MDKKYVLGIDIGGTNFRMGIVDNAFRLVNFERHNCKATLGDNAIENLINSIKEYTSKWADECPVEMIAIGVPGHVGKNHSFVHSVPKVRSLEGVELGQIIAEATGIPTYIDKDTNFLLYHDIQIMNLDPDENKTILGFYIGTGFGNAIYIDGKLHTGTHGAAAELGHIPLYGVEDICNCGAVGCVETRCCGAALANIVEKDFPGVYIGDIFEKHGNDPRIIKFVKDCALPIATELTILDPDYALMGGGVVAMTNFPTTLLEEEVVRRTRHPHPAEDIKFIYASDSQTNGVMGAGMIAHKILAKATE